MHEKKIINILHKNNHVSVNKPISFGEFMNLALYQKENGYYMKKLPFGKNADFVTSPEISQLFGECIAIFIVNLWLNNIKQQELEIIEIGAGSGYLMLDIIRIIKQFPQCYQKVKFKIIEKSPLLIEIQKNKLKQYYDKIEWIKNFPKNKKQKLFIANEFFDALPIEQYQKHNGIIKQKFITINENEQIFIDKLPIKQNQLPEYVKQKFENFGEKYNDNKIIVEYSKNAENYLMKICQSLKESFGFALIIDYGYTLKNACGDTVQAIKQHKYSKINENIGESDISAHVDFNLLKQIAKKNQLISQNIISQAEFLINMGIEAIVEKHSLNANYQQKQKLLRQKNKIIETKNNISMGNLFKVLLLHDKQNTAPYPFGR